MTPRETLGPSAAFAANIVTGTPASAAKGEAVAWRYRYPNDEAWQLTQDHDQAFKNTGEVEPLGVIPFGSEPSQQAGAEGAYAAAEAERDHWLKEAMKHKRPGRRSDHEQSDLERARIAQRIMDKIAALNPSEAKG